MVLHRTKAEALVKWVNSLNLSDKIKNLTQLQDCAVFIKIVCWISGKESDSQLIEDQTIEDRLRFVCNFLERSEHKTSQPEHIKYNPSVGDLVSCQEFLYGEDVELEVAKVTVLLLHYYTLAKHLPSEFEILDTQTQGELVAMLRCVLDNEDGIHLDKNLATFLRSSGTSTVTQLFSASSDEVTSPIASWRGGGVKTQFASTSSVYSYVPSGSPISPMQHFIRTPQVQMRRLKTQLMDIRTLRDELEIELTETQKQVTEKDTQISILQQRIDRLVKLNQANQQEPRELVSLRESNESLLIRLRDIQKQCQDMKTEKTQMERKIDKLEEENGDLSYKVRDLGSHLLQSQKALNELTDEHEAAVPMWEGKQKELEQDLTGVLTEKKCLEEKVQFLEGKLSILEDQLKEVGETHSDCKGEVMGDVLQLEALKQEVWELTSELEQERVQHGEEQQRLNERMASLQQANGDMALEKALLEEANRARDEQLDLLNAEMGTLKLALAQKELEFEMSNRQAREWAERERATQNTVLDLNSKLACLEETLRAKEEAVAGFRQEMEAEIANQAQQLVALQEALQRVSSEKESVELQCAALKISKEMNIEALTRQVERLEGDQAANLAVVADLQQEKNELVERVQQLDIKVLDAASKLQNLEATFEIQNQAHLEEVHSLTLKVKEAEGQVEEGKRESANSRRERDQLEGQLRAGQDTLGDLQGALESKKQQMTKLESRIGELAQEREGFRVELSEEVERRAEAERDFQQSSSQQGEAMAGLQSKLTIALALVKEKEEEEERLRSEVTSWQGRFEAAQEEGACSLSRLEEVVLQLKGEGERARAQLGGERERSKGLELRIAQLSSEWEENAARVQRELSTALSQIKAREAVEEKALLEAAAMKERLEQAQREAAEQVAQAGEEVKRVMEESDGVRQVLCEERTLAEQAKAVEAERLARISTLEQDLTTVRRALEEKGAQGERWRGETEALRTKLEELRATQAEAQEQARGALQEKVRAQAELQEERLGRAALVQAAEEQQHRLSSVQGQLAEAFAKAQAREAEEKQLRAEAEIRLKESELQQERLSILQGEVAAMGELRVKLLEQEQEIQRCQDLANTREQQTHHLLAKVKAGEEEVERCRHGAAMTEIQLATSRHLCQEKLEEVQELSAQVTEMTLSCEQKQGLIAKLESEQTSQAMQSREDRAMLEAEVARARSCLKEGEMSEQCLKETMAEQEQTIKKQASLIHSLELEDSGSQLKRAEAERANESLREQVTADQEDNRKLQEKIKTLEVEVASASADTLKKTELLDCTMCELASLKQEIIGQKTTLEKLEGELAVERVWKEKVVSEAETERNQRLALEGDLDTSQKDLEQAQADLAQQARQTADLHTQLESVKSQLTTLLPLQAKCQEQDTAIQQLQAQRLSQQAQVSELQHSNNQLVTELHEQASHSQKVLEEERAKVQAAHTLQSAGYEEQLSTIRASEQELRDSLQAVSSKYEHAKAKVLDDCRQFQEKRQRLETQVEELQEQLVTASQKTEELNQKLAQHEAVAKAKLQKHQAFKSETEKKWEQQQQQVVELTERLRKAEEAVQHYKTQMEKAKTHYDSKKQLSQELSEELARARQETAGMQSETERLNRELQLSLTQSKEAAEQNKDLCTQVLSLESQLDHADRQLRERGALCLTAGPTKHRGQSWEKAEEQEGNFSKDSIELSDLVETTMKWEDEDNRKESTVVKTPKAGRGRRSASQESLKSLYFTPLPQSTRSKLDTSICSFNDLSLDSSKRTRSGRRRTTINILMTKKQTTVEHDEPSSSNSSFYSMKSAKSHPSLSNQAQPQASRRDRPMSVTSLSSFDSSPSLAALSSEDVGAAKLLNLPGYRPSVTRSSTFGSVVSSTNTLYPGSCQDEPEHLDDWNRIAELQRRNGTCPPHLKTSYPLESNTADKCSLTEDELRLGDPNETLRRATLMPQQIKDMTAHCQPAVAFTVDSYPGSNGVTTRQQKRLSEETHHGRGTPQSKKQARCFPRPMTPKEKKKSGLPWFDTKSRRQSPNKGKRQAEPRKLMAFNVPNSPRKPPGGNLMSNIRKITTPRAVSKSKKKSPKAPANSKMVNYRKSPRNVKM